MLIETTCDIVSVLTTQGWNKLLDDEVKWASDLEFHLKKLDLILKEFHEFCYMPPKFSFDCELSSYLVAIFHALDSKTVG